MHRGFVPFWRKSLESRVFYSAELWQLWCYILLKARTEPGWVPVKISDSMTEVHLKEGQMIFGRLTTSKILNQNPSSTRNRLEKLENMQNITIQSTKHYSIITVTNWDTYAQYSKNMDSQQDNQRTTRGQPEDTKNNEEQLRTTKNHEEYIVPAGAQRRPQTKPCPHSDIVKLYHELLPELPGVIKWTDKRKKALAARWKEDEDRQTLDWWHRYFELVRDQDFLMGGNGKGWNATLEWLVQESNMLKVLEGKYLSKSSKPIIPGMPEGMLSEKGQRTALNIKRFWEEKNGRDPV